MFRFGPIVLRVGAAIVLSGAAPAARQGVPGSPPAQSTTPVPPPYALNAAQSTVTAKVRVLGISSKTVRFPSVSGTLVYGGIGEPRFDLKVRIEATQLNTGSASDDDMLKGSDFFDVAHHPVVMFDGARMTLNSQTSATVEGMLDLRGVRKPLTLSVTTDQPIMTMMENRTINLRAKGQFSRSAFGMSAMRAFVSDKVELDVAAHFDAAQSGG